MLFIILEQMVERVLWQNRHNSSIPCSMKFLFTSVLTYWLKNCQVIAGLTLVPDTEPDKACLIIHNTLVKQQATSQWLSRACNKFDAYRWKCLFRSHWSEGYHYVENLVYFQSNRCNQFNISVTLLEVVTLLHYIIFDSSRGIAQICLSELSWMLWLLADWLKKV